MKQLTALSVIEAYEIGPGKVLSGLMRRINKEIKCKGVDSADDVKSLAG